MAPTTSSARAGSTSFTATLAPSAANRSATARPMPWPAPVTSTLCPANRPLIDEAPWSKTPPALSPPAPYDGPMRLTVGLAQFLATPGAPRDNLERALGHIASLAAGACDLIVLPELWPCGFSWDTLADDARAAAEPLDGPRGAALAAAAERAGAWLLAGTVPELTADGIANTAVLYAPDGRLVATHRK